MKTIVKRMSALLAALSTPPARPDPLPTFSPREWADLPVHHPIADRTPPV